MIKLSELTWRAGESLSEDNLNKRAKVIHTSIKALEAVAFDFSEAREDLLALSLAYIRETFEPALQAALGVVDLGALFTGVSDTTVTVGLGTRTFVLPPAQRELFAPTRTLLAYPTAEPLTRMEATLVSYDTETGFLVVDAITAEGAVGSTHSAWTITPAVPSGATSAYVDAADDDVRTYVDAKDTAVRASFAAADGVLAQAVADVDDRVDGLASRADASDVTISDLNALTQQNASTVAGVNDSLNAVQSTVAAIDASQNSLQAAIAAVEASALSAGEVAPVQRITTTQTSGVGVIHCPNGIYVEDGSAKSPAEFSGMLTAKSSDNRGFQVAVGSDETVAVRRFHSTETDGVSGWFSIAVEATDVAFTNVSVASNVKADMLFTGRGIDLDYAAQGGLLDETGSLRLKAHGAAPGTKRMMQVVAHTGASTEQRFEVHASGDVFSRTGSFGTFSDEREKDAITDAPSLLDDYASIPARSFVRRGGSGEREVCLVVQDTDWSGMPEEIARLVTHDAAADRYSLNQAGMAMLNFAVIHELIDKVRALEARVAQLEGS
jgi:hypothetical protein